MPSASQFLSEIEPKRRSASGFLDEPEVAPKPVREFPVGAVEGFPGVLTTREAVRTGVEQLPAPVRFALEAGPSIAGTAIGGLAGTAIGQPLIGAAAGGLAGEAFAQDIGFAPESRIGLVAAGAAPPLARGIAGGLRAGGRFATRFPIIRNALSQIDLEAMVTQAGKMGADILERGKGLLGRSAATLYRALSRISPKFTVGPDDLPLTASALDTLEQRLAPHAALEETGKLLAVIQSMRRHVFGKTALGGEGNLPIDLDVLMLHRKILGNQIGKWEAAAGTKLGAAKVLFKSLNKDVEKLPFRLQGKLGAAESAQLARATDIFKAAPQRAKLEFAVQDLETKVAQWADGKIGSKQIVQWLKGVTNPKNEAAFDRNFTQAMRGEIPGLVKFFEDAVRLEQKTGFGPGSLAAAGRFGELGRRIIGGALGGATGGLLSGEAAFIGTMAGLMMPQWIAEKLATGGGRQFLLHTMERGRIIDAFLADTRTIATLAQVARGTLGTETGREVAGKALEFGAKKLRDPLETLKTGRITQGVLDAMRSRELSLEEKIEAAQGLFSPSP